MSVTQTTASRFAFLHAAAQSEPDLELPEIGLSLWVCLPPQASGGQLTVIETENASGFGPPLHRHAETEVFRVTTGRYLFEVDGRRFHAATGDVVCVPGGTPHGFVNIAADPARQIVLILPGLDAVAFFTELHAALGGGPGDPAKLAEFGQRWGVDFLGPPLKPDS